jgi:hypothetical protein
MPLDIRAAVQRKLAIFSDGDPFAPTGVCPDPRLLQQDVDKVAMSEPAREVVLLDRAYRLQSVDPGEDYVPAQLTGEVRTQGRGDGPPVRLAVAVNGRILATTLANRSRRSRWSALIPPDSLQRGRNDVRIFVVEGDADRTVLRPAFVSQQPVGLNLLSSTARRVWNVRHTGFHEPEMEGSHTYRWLDDAASVVTPIDPDRPPAAIRMAIVKTAPGGVPLRVRANGCEVFSGAIEGASVRVLSMTGCRVSGSTLTIDLLTRDSASPPREAREPGLAIEELSLVPEAGTASR